MINSIDKIDIKILEIFSKLEEGEATTTWKVMKEIFPHSCEESMIKYRLRKMSKMGIFLIEKKSKEKFLMISDYVIFDNNYKFKDKISRAVQIKLCNKWAIFEI